MLTSEACTGVQNDPTTAHPLPLRETDCSVLSLGDSRGGMFHVDEHEDPGVSVPEGWRGNTQECPPSGSGGVGLHGPREPPSFNVPDLNDQDHCEASAELAGELMI